jgi:hypothetical protein
MVLRKSRALVIMYKIDKVLHTSENDVALSIWQILEVILFEVDSHVCHLDGLQHRTGTGLGMHQ